jgi:aldose 1-epimerase
MKLLKLASGLALVACLATALPAFAADTITKASFGKTNDGTPVSIYTLTNANGVQAKISNFGGIIVSLEVPDRNNKLGDIVLGLNNPQEYLKESPYFGALIGRCGNRIAKGTFKIDGVTYHVPVNNGPNSLHGGLVGFDKRVWNATPKVVAHGVSLQLGLLSKDGDQGYPGNLHATVVYTLTDANALQISYTATTDKATVCNLTNHTYWNLNGEGNGTILDNVMKINANYITPVDKTLIPTGKLMRVAGTPFDFRKPTAIGLRIGSSNQQIQYGPGYDHNFVLNRKGAGSMLAVEVYAPKTGRVLDVYTDQPGVQFYTGNFLDGTIVGRGGKPYVRRGAIALETQHFPDSVNHPQFPSTILRPGQVYHTVTMYKFGIRK